MTKVLLIVNPSSGGEKAAEYKKMAQESLQKMFTEVVTKETTGDGDATKFAKTAVDENVDAVFVMGGDGSVNETISGLAGAEQPPKFGFFPLGTVNDLARALGISLEPEQAIQEVVDYQPRPLDVGKINDSYFMNSVALGDISEAVNNVSVEEKTKLGSLAYFVAGAKSFIKNEPHEFQMVIDGQQEIFVGSTVMIGLTNSMGGFENLFPDAKVDDGKFHMIYLEDQNKLDMIRSAPQLLMGVTEDGAKLSYRTFTEAEISLTDHQQLPVNVDGDGGLKLPIHLKLLPAHLEVYCPVNDLS
ncbi:diacylglycerol/lipid kinase family protein [Enterococcus sp. LJL90]